MRRFHVIGVTRDLTRTLAVRTEAGWLLPWLDDDPRYELPLQLQSLLNSLVPTSEMVHEAPVSPASRGEAVSHGYCAAVVSEGHLSNGIVAIPHSQMLESPAVIGIQRQAWLLAVARLGAPVADFDSAARVASALEWVEQELARRADARVLSLTRHRCSRYEYVLRLDTTKGAMYFKGGSTRVADEAVLTDLLYGLDTRSLPQTVAMDGARTRWIYRELPGELLMGSRLTVHTAAAAVAGLAALQKRTLTSPAVRSHLAARCLTATAVLDAADQTVRAASLAGDSTEFDRLRDAWRARRDVMWDRCGAVDRLNLPLSLVLSDFWPRNVLATCDGIGFIDVERSYWSLPLLPLWRFTREVERILGTEDHVRDRIESVFASVWDDVIPAADMVRALAELPLLGNLFGLLLAAQELELLERDLGSELPCTFRASTLSIHVRRVLEGLDCLAMYPQAG